ncbi:hypothetical protein D4764_21G0001530, partial [Takifugu flavidus]
YFFKGVFKALGPVPGAADNLCNKSRRLSDRSADTDAVLAADKSRQGRRNNIISGCCCREEEEEEEEEVVVRLQEVRSQPGPDNVPVTFMKLLGPFVSRTSGSGTECKDLISKSAQLSLVNICISFLLSDTDAALQLD